MENSYNRDYVSHKRSLNKVSFRSIIAGVIIAVIVQLLLSLLGMGIGLVSFTPTTDENPFYGFGTGAIIWLILTTVISLFAGGWVSGWLATSTNKIDRILHGLLTWALYTLLSIFLVSSSIGSVLGGIGNVISKTFSSNQNTVYIKDSNDSQSNDSSNNNNMLNINSQDLESLKNEAMTLLRQTEKTKLQPENLENKGENLVDDAKDAAENAAKDPSEADAELESVISKLFNNSDEVLSEMDKEAVVNIVANRTNKSKAEAEQIVDNWIGSAQSLKGDAKNIVENVKQEVEVVAEEVKEKAEVVSEDVTDSIGKFAIYLFFGLVLGAVSSVLGSLFTKNKIAYDDTTR